MISSAKILETLIGEGSVGPASVEAGDLAKALPMMSAASFSLETVSALGEETLVARPVRSMKPAELIRQALLLARSAGLQTIVRIEQITPYLRRGLIAAEVGFLTDDGEFFMPAKIRLRVAKEPAPRIARTSLPPTAKAAALSILLNPGQEVTSADIASRLGISPTAAKRALRTLLDETSLAKSVAGPTGRTFFYRIDDLESFAEDVSEAFGPAVRERILVAEGDAAGLPLCGLSALSERSLLSPPKTPQVAAAPSEAAALRLAAISEVGGERLVEVSVLDYDPSPFAEGGIVDPFTMMKTTRESDERIEMAIEEASEEVPWLRLIR